MQSCAAASGRIAAANPGCLSRSRQAWVRPLTVQPAAVPACSHSWTPLTPSTDSRVHRPARGRLDAPRFAIDTYLFSRSALNGCRAAGRHASASEPAAHYPHDA